MGQVRWTERVDGEVGGAGEGGCDVKERVEKLLDWQVGQVRDV